MVPDVNELLEKRLGIPRALKPLGILVETNNKKNTNGEYAEESLKGLSDKNKFAETTAKVKKEDLVKYLIIDNNEFAINFMCLGNFGKFYLAYNDSDSAYIVSPACTAFRIINSEELNPYYLMLVLTREEFQRHCVFLGDGNTRGGINFDDFGTLAIPVIDKEKQIAVANIYKVLNERKAINEEMKAKIKEMCPILIKGSLEEAATA